MLVAYDYERREPVDDPRRLAGEAGRLMSVFERHTLDNGLRVLTADMPQVQSVTCMIMLAAGSRYETPETNGIAHFAEHMFFKGTERRPTARDIGMEVDGDRRRVQRLHEQGVHGLLRQVRGRVPRPARSTCSSTCSATRSSRPRRSSARRA